MTGHTPFRWEFGRDGHLAEMATEQKSIAQMRRLGAEGLSYRGNAARLADEGIRGDRPRRWMHTKVRSILARNAAPWNRTRSEPKQ